MTYFVWKKIFPLPFLIFWLLFSFGYSSHISQHAEYVSPSSTLIEPSWTREILSSEPVSQIEKPSEAVQKQPQEVKTAAEDIVNDQIIKNNVDNIENIPNVQITKDDVEQVAKENIEKEVQELDSEVVNPVSASDKIVSQHSSSEETKDSKSTKASLASEKTSSESGAEEKEKDNLKIQQAVPASTPDKPSKSGKSTVAEDTEKPPPKEETVEKKASPQLTTSTDASSLPSDNAPEPGAHGSEFIPSFDEWKKMMLAEQEKEGGQKVASVVSGKKLTSHKRRRNYASYECGAKVVAANPEAESKSRILNEMMDEYMLNPCKVKIWFVIELCDTIQATQLELANFELFSSSPKEFTVYWSEHFPSRDWTSLGTFVAQDIRTLQSFDLPQGGFGKFIKIELHGYYGSEHYCPLSIVRVFGTSMVDEYEALETPDVSLQILEDDEDRLDASTEDTASPASNLFGSARDAVINIVRKAKEALTGDSEKQVNEVAEDAKKIQKNGSLDNWVSSAVQDGASTAKKNDSQKPDSGKPKSCPDKPINSLVKLLSPYINRCRFCSSLPATDRHHTYAEPTQLCRFLQATLGPLVFQAVCTEYQQQIHLINHQSTCSKSVTSCSLAIETPPSLTEQSGGLDTATTDTQPPMSEVHAIDSAFTKEPVYTPTFSLESLATSTESVQVVSSETHVQDVVTPPVAGSMKLSDLPFQSDSEINLKSSEFSSLGTSETPPLPKLTTPTSELHASTINQIDPKIGFPGPSMESIATPPTDSLSTYSSLTSIEEQMTPLPESMVVTEIPGTVSETESIASTVTQSAELPTVSKDSHIKVGSHHDEKPGKFQNDNSVPQGSAVVSGNVDNIMVPVAGQKESVFMRLSNRIKHLELNMSLSSQYLEELSQRYRKQMEEMQRAFNRTVGRLNDTARKAAERDIRQQEAIGHLQNQLSNLTSAVNALIDQRDSLHRQMMETHLCLMLVEAIVMITILSLCVRRMVSQNHPNGNLGAKTVLSSSHLHPTPLKRHNSVGVLSSPLNEAISKKRRYSDEILSGSSPHLMIVEPSIPILVDPPPKVKKKQKNKKNKGAVHPPKSSSLSQLNNVCPPEQLPSQKEPEDDVRWKHLERMHSSPAGVLFSYAADKNATCPTQSDSQIVKCSNQEIKSKGDKTGSKQHETIINKRSMSLVPLQNISNGHHQKLKPKDKPPAVQIFSWKKLLRLEKRQSF